MDNNTALLWDLPSTVVTGGAGNLYGTNELPVDMHKKQFTTFPALTPLTVILGKMESQNAFNFRIDWFEQKEIPTEVVVTGALASGGTALKIAGGAYTCVLDSLLFNSRTQDIAEVGSAPSSATALTVSRGACGTTAAAWVLNDVLQVLPPMIPEDDQDTYRTSSVADVDVYNLMQLSRLQFAITRTANGQSSHWGGPGWKRARLQAQKYRECRMKHEKMLYFGRRSSSGTAPTSSRSMGGLCHFLLDGTLYRDFNGIMTESGFRSWIGDYLDQNPEATNIWYFTSRNVIDIINGWAKGSVRISPESKKYGVDIYEYVATGARVKLVRLPMLNDPYTKGWGWLLDMDKIMMKTLSPLTLHKEAKNVGESERIIDTYRWQTSLLVGDEKSHGMSVGALL